MDFGKRVDINHLYIAVYTRMLIRDVGNKSKATISKISL